MTHRVVHETKIAPPLLRRALLIALGLALSWLVIAVGVANSFRQLAPGIALQWWPWDARAKSNLVRSRLNEIANPAVRASLISQLQSSLSRDATYAPAIRNLALMFSADSDIAQTGRLMHLSARLSRRDLPTRLWLIEERVRANDVAGALRHFDLALRTSEEAKDVLFPILIRATAEPDLVEPIAALIAQRQRWTEAFLPRLLAQAPSPPRLVQLVEAMARRRALLPRDLMQSVIEQLGGQHRFDLAWRLFLAAGGNGASRDGVRNGDFDRDNSFPPVDWLLSNDPQLATAVENRRDDDANPTLGFNVGPAAAGRIAWQLQGLSAGTYQLSAEAGGLSSGADLHWIVFCGGQQPVPLLDYRIPAQPDGARHSAELRIPSQGCASQIVSLMVIAGGQNDGTRAWIDAVSILRTPG